MPSAFNTHNTNPLASYPQAWERASKIKLLVLDVDGVLTRRINAEIINPRP
jgi:3-deoxy-D-manno-octulosonate 8-phosphate phosphatase (KDO 8-P phosphatase)